MNEVIVSTGDIKQDYDIIGPVYFSISNKGVFSSALTKYSKKHFDQLTALKKQGQTDDGKIDWTWIYGEFSFGMQNDFDKAFFIAVRELQERAKKLGADAIVSMRQDIDLDSNGFQYFYLQMYGTAVKLK